MEFTLVLTIGLVVMVIFLFLRNLTATLIPGSAVVLSIVGTFAAMYLLGYSLNTLSLMALTLSVGFVVDDAIVMLENIVRYMEMGKSRYEAAMLASKEIGFTIVSMTLSLIAVFIPVLFLGGMVGRLLHEFSVTIIVAIVISGFVSLTFTPMLGSRYLPPHDRKHGRLYVALERGFEKLAGAYDVTLRAVLRHKFATMVVAAATLAGTVYLFTDHADRILPEPGQRIRFRSHDGGTGCLVRIHGAAAKGGVRHPAGGRERGERGGVFVRQQRGLPVFDDEAEGPSARFPWIETIDGAAAEAGPGAGDHDVSSESAADHDQRTVQHQPLSDDRFRA